MSEMLGTHLVHRDNISQPDPEIVAHCLVHADLSFLHCVIHQHNAHSVLALLAL